MKKCFTRLILSIWLMAIAAVPALAQTTPTFTTLSAALSGGSSNNTVTVTSATGITASTGSLQTFILVDRELMQVRSVSGTTLTVNRAVKGNATGHISGARVIFGMGGSFDPASGTIGGPSTGAPIFIDARTSPPSGSCTRSANRYLPVFDPAANGGNGVTYDCVGGQWIAGTLPDLPGQPLPGSLLKVCNIPVGPVAYASIGTDAVSVAGTLYRSTIFVPQTIMATGIALLNGTTAGTDAVIYALYDAGTTATLLANTALAGTTASGADAFQSIAFTATRFVTGPALYHLGLQVNGTTTQHQRVAASTYNMAASSATGTFGTLPTFTSPTTFTAGAGPIGCIY